LETNPVSTAPVAGLTAPSFPYCPGDVEAAVPVLEVAHGALLDEGRERRDRLAVAGVDRREPGLREAADRRERAAEVHRGADRLDRVDRGRRLGLPGGVELA
jgi:hypothetical protein